MNYGFVGSKGDSKELPLFADDEPDRLQIQLYHHVVCSIDVSNKDLLEVGCGRGGGCSYVARYLRPKSVIGIDASRRAIKFCNERHRYEGLYFLRGEAEALPLASESFDILVNVESSHCYGSMESFLSEVHRVLRPKGYLLFADLRKQTQLALLRKQFNQAGFCILSGETITSYVLKALDEDSDRKLSLIREKTPRLLQKLITEVAATRGSLIYESIFFRRSEYVSYVLRKR